MDTLRLLYDIIIRENTTLGKLLVTCIAAIAVIAVMMALYHYRRYRGSEGRYLNQIKTRLRMALSAPVEPEAGAPLSTSSTEQDTPATLSGSAPSRVSGLISPDELLSGVPAHSLIGDRLHVMALLRKSRTKVSLAALQQLSRAREASRTSLRFPAMAVNLTMLIGLLGTFIGIAIMIQPIADSMRQGEVPGESFAQAFSGMYTKFSTTLVGLTCAIVVSFLNFRVAQAQERMFEDLDRFTVSELLPATVPALEDETMLERVSQQLEQSFTLLEELARKNAKTVEEVGAIQAGFTDIVANIRKQMRTETSDRLQNLLGHVASLMQQIGAVSGSLQNLASALPAAIRDSSQRMEKEASERLQNLHGHVSGQVQQLSRVADTLQGLSSAIPAAMRDSNDKLEKTLKFQVLQPSTEQPRKAPYARWLLVFGTVVVGLLVIILVKLG